MFFCLYGHAADIEKHSSNAMSFHNVLPKLLNPVVNASGCTLMVMHVEFFGTAHSLFWVKVILSPFLLNS